MSPALWSVRGQGLGASSPAAPLPRLGFVWGCVSPSPCGSSARSPCSLPRQPLSCSGMRRLAFGDVCLLAWLFSICRGAERTCGLFASNPTWDLGLRHPEVALLPSWSLAAFGFAGHSAVFFFMAHAQPGSSGTRTFLALQVNFSFWPLALRTVAWLFPFHLCEQRLLIFSSLGVSDPEIENFKKRLKSLEQF